MGKLKEISSFKRREIAQELGKEGSNNYAIMFRGKKTFWKVVSSKRLADKIVATLKRQGKDAKVVLTAAPVSEESVNEDLLKEFKFPNVKKAISFFKKAFKRTTSIPKRISNKIKDYIDSLELEDVEDIYRADIPVVSGLAEIILYTKYNYTANQIQKIKQESVKVRKNKTGMMGSKTQVHKDKKKELSKTAGRKKVSMDEKVEYLTLNQIKKNWAKEYPGTKFKFQVSKLKGAEILSVLSPKGAELEVYDKVPKQGWTVREMKEEIEKDIEEGVDDPAIFKAVFLAGGPGSGKSFTVGKTGLGALGFRIVNSDEVFEFALKKAGLEATPKDIFSPKGQEIRKGAKKLTAKKMDLYLDGRLGLVIDGTGKDFSKIQKQATALKKIGYDVGMIFVNTNLETAVARDAKRARTLGADKVEKMWQEVQDNIGKFQNLFGSNFTIVDNSEGANWQKATLGAYKKVSKFAKSPVKSPTAKKWIKDAGGRLKDMKVENLDEVTATDKAIAGVAGALIGKGIKRFGTKKGREGAAKKKSDKKKEKVDRALGAFDRKIDAIDDQIKDLEDLISDIEEKDKDTTPEKKKKDKGEKKDNGDEKEESFQEALNDADKQKVAAAREKILRLKDAKRKIKDQRRQKKNKLLGIKDSFSIDMQRKLAMVEHVLGDVDNDIQIAESITLQSTPSHIKEINKKLYGKNDKGRSEQTR